MTDRATPAEAEPPGDTPTSPWRSRGVLLVGIFIVSAGLLSLLHPGLRLEAWGLLAQYGPPSLRERARLALIDGGEASLGTRLRLAAYADLPAEERSGLLHRVDEHGARLPDHLGALVELACDPALERDGPRLLTIASHFAPARVTAFISDERSDVAAAATAALCWRGVNEVTSESIRLALAGTVASFVIEGYEAAELTAPELDAALEELWRTSAARDGAREAVLLIDASRGKTDRLREELRSEDATRRARVVELMSQLGEREARVFRSTLERIGDAELQPLAEAIEARLTRR